MYIFIWNITLFYLKMKDISPQNLWGFFKISVTILCRRVFNDSFKIHPIWSLILYMIKTGYLQLTHLIVVTQSTIKAIRLRYCIKLIKVQFSDCSKQWDYTNVFLRRHIFLFTMKSSSETRKLNLWHISMHKKQLSSQT